MQPLVSILIPAYNSSLTIHNTIVSCLNQTYSNFELIILDSSRSESTKNIVNSFDDHRIQYVESESNQGIAASRNRLLQLAKGDFIAWLDADDEMLETRLEKQIAYFNSHPDLDILGSWISTDSKEIPVKKLPLLHQEIAQSLWFKNCLIQPAIMSRNFYSRESIWYDETYANSAEDYELWYRLSKVKKIGNIPIVLTKYHITTGKELEEKKKRNQFSSNINRLWDKKWADLPVQADLKDKQLFVKFIYENFVPNQFEFRSILKILNELKRLKREPYFNLLIDYHLLRLWRNAQISDKLRHLSFLFLIAKWPTFKQYYLV